jgi:hypothetical protein
MDKKKANEILKEALNEIDNLAKLHGRSEDFKLWIEKVLLTVERTSGKNSREYKQLINIKKDFDKKYEDSFTLAVQLGTLEATNPRWDESLYRSALREFKTVLKSIIQKHEILGIGKKEQISIAPEEIFQLVPPKAFISHGKESAALRNLREFIETLGIEPLIVKKQASRDKDVPDKVNFYLNQADFVIILATGDDEFEGKLHPRQNVIHEIGLAQKTHPGRIIYLLEEGTEFPSNIRPKVRESFKRRNMMDAFLGIVRELKDYGILQVIKTPKKEHSL